MLSRTAQRSKVMLSLLFNVRRERKAHARAAAPQAQIRVLFSSRWVDGLHANGLVSYASDRITTKQALREARGVRRDVRAQSFHMNFTLGQRVKLRLSEPINAALEFRA